MNSCALETQLTSYLLGDLPPSATEAVRAHLETCVTCRAEAAALAPVLATLRAVLAADRHVPAVLAPDRLTRVLATPPRRFAGHTGFARRRGAPYRLPPAIRPFLGIAATLVFVFALVIPHMTRERRSRTDGSRAMPAEDAERGGGRALQVGVDKTAGRRQEAVSAAAAPPPARLEAPERQRHPGTPAREDAEQIAYAHALPAAAAALP